MKILAAPIRRTERDAKDQVCELADGYLAQHYRAIKGINVKGAWTTHSWAEHSEYADPKFAFTVLVPTGLDFKHSALKVLFLQTKTVFKDLGEPRIWWQRKGMLIAIGFNTDLKRLEHLTEMYS